MPRFKAGKANGPANGKLLTICPNSTVCVGKVAPANEKMPFCCSTNSAASTTIVNTAEKMSGAPGAGPGPVAPVGPVVPLGPVGPVGPVGVVEPTVNVPKPPLEPKLAVP